MAARPRRLSLTRRELLAVAGSAALLTACGRSPDPAAPAAGVRRVRYAEDHQSQFADLRMPEGTSSGTVVLLHGGYWLAPNGLELTEPLARRFTELGYATWNVEYRRTGDGGGFPATFLDVAAAIDRLAEDGLPPRLAENVVLVGHSAGGHLAVWAASRTADTPGGPPAVVPAAAVSLAGVLDLTLAAGAPGSQGPVTALLGGDPLDVPQRYALGDPTLLVPAACPVQVVQAEDDGVVPAEQGRSYVEHARRAGATGIKLVEVTGDHTTVIDPIAASFAAVRGLVERMLAQAAG